MAVLVIDDFHAHKDNIKTHGELVYELFLNLFKEAGLDPNSSLFPVNIADDRGYRSDLIATAVYQTVAKLYLNQHIQRFVLSMSFVIVPCEVKLSGGTYDYTAFLNSDLSLTDYMKQNGLSLTELLATQPEGDNTGLKLAANSLPEYLKGGITFAPQAKLVSYQAQATILDDLHKLVAQLEADSTADGFMTVAVGSAGNFGTSSNHPEPLYPARWPEFLSISALLGPSSNFQGLWNGSNSGQVALPGAWYPFDDGRYRDGTSLAAPGASTLLAVCLTHPKLAWTPPITALANAHDMAYNEAFSRICAP